MALLLLLRRRVCLCLPTCFGSYSTRTRSILLTVLSGLILLSSASAALGSYSSTAASPRRPHGEGGALLGRGGQSASRSSRWEGENGKTRFRSATIAETPTSPATKSRRSPFGRRRLSSMSTTDGTSSSSPGASASPGPPPENVSLASEDELDEQTMRDDISPLNKGVWQPIVVDPEDLRDTWWMALPGEEPSVQPTSSVLLEEPEVYDLAAEEEGGVILEKPSVDFDASEAMARNLLRPQRRGKKKNGKRIIWTALDVPGLTAPLLQESVRAAAADSFGEDYISGAFDTLETRS